MFDVRIGIILVMILFATFGVTCFILGHSLGMLQGRARGIIEAQSRTVITTDATRPPTADEIVAVMHELVEK